MVRWPLVLYSHWWNSGLLNQDILRRQRTLDAKPEVFLDPTKLSEDGSVSVPVSSFSANAKYFAYQQSKGGSDAVRIVIDVVLR